MSLTTPAAISPKAQSVSMEAAAQTFVVPGGSASVGPEAQLVSFLMEATETEVLTIEEMAVVAPSLEIEALGGTESCSAGGIDICGTDGISINVRDTEGWRGSCASGRRGSGGIS